MGLDGSKSCPDCCYQCATTGVSVRLTCGSVTPSPIVQLPTLQCRATPSGTSVTIENRTSYTVTVTFEGPTRGTVTYSAGQTRTTTISPGTYTLTASASGVLTATRTQSLTGSCDYGLVITISS